MNVLYVCGNVYSKSDKKEASKRAALLLENLVRKLKSLQRPGERGTKGNMAGSNDPFKALKRLLRSNPFWVGWSLGMLVGAVFLTFQWHYQANVPVDDWVLEIGWPLIFHKSGGFYGLYEFYFWPFVLDFGVWALISAVPGLLLRWLVPRIIK